MSLICFKNIFGHFSCFLSFYFHDFVVFTSARRESRIPSIELPFDLSVLTPPPSPTFKPKKCKFSLLVNIYVNCSQNLYIFRVEISRILAIESPRSSTVTPPEPFWDEQSELEEELEKEACKFLHTKAL